MEKHRGPCTMRGPRLHTEPGTGYMTGSRPGRRVGYAVAAGINAGLYYVVAHIVEWGWPRFVTGEFDRVDEIVRLSLATAAIANIVYVWNDTMPLKAFMESTLNLVSLAAAIRLWQVFPFDFSDSGFDWTTIARLVLGLAMLGTAIAIISNLTRGVRLVVAGE